MSNEMINRCVSAVRRKELTQYEDIVKEVIIQLMEPTDFMINAAYKKASENGGSAYDCWQDMLKAILNKDA